MEMQTKSKPKGLKKHYKITTIRDGQMSEQVLTRQERDRLDPNDVDVQIDEPLRAISIKQKDGMKSATFGPEDMPGFGEVEWKLLTDIMFSGGDMLKLEQDCSIHQRVRRLRRFFGDSKDRARFFITAAKPYGIAIATARTWRFVEVLAE